MIMHSFPICTVPVTVHGGTFGTESAVRKRGGSNENRCSPRKYKGYSDFIFTQLPKTGYIFFISIIQIFVFFCIFCSQTSRSVHRQYHLLREFL